ncbi:MAG: HAMP domain-containing sensor histidine kinase [Planctomycetota bacterium]
MLHLVRSRISARLTLLFLLASLVPVLAVSYLTLVQLRGAVERDAGRRLDLRAGVVEDLLLDAVTRAEEKLTTVTRLLASELAESGVGAFHFSNDPYRATVVDRLSSLVEPAGVFLELQYFSGGADGDEPAFVGQAQQIVVAEAQRRRADATTRNSAILKNNMVDVVVRKPIAGAPHRDADFTDHEGFPSLRLSAPLHEPSGGKGALVAYIDFRELTDTLSRLAGEEAAIRIADAGGTLLSDVGALDGERLVRERVVGAAGWSVEVAESEAAVLAPLARLRRRILPWALGAAVASVAASLLFSMRVTRPIGRLQRAAEAMERGDLAVRAGVQREDEIGALAAAFDRMAAALHQLDQAKSEFIGNVSHELRTPLTSLRLTVANVLDGVTGDVSPAQRTALERVRRELARLSALVDDLLELARLEAGVVEPKCERVDLALLSSDCAESLAPTADERGVTVEVHGAGEARADPAMVRRVLLNLLDNAIKFSPEGSGVRVRVGPARIEVEDEGPGGVPEDAFERFRQGGRDGVKHGGAGLGLAIVERLVAMHGGRVSVTCDGGATFRVDLAGEDAA